MYYNLWFKTLDLAPRPSEICKDRDVERRYPPKIEPAACNEHSKRFLQIQAIVFWYENCNVSVSG